MTGFVLHHFDALEFVDKSKELGVDEKVAKYQARQFEQAIEIAVNTARAEIENKDLATSKDIEIVHKDIGIVVRKEVEVVRREVEVVRREVEVVRKEVEVVRKEIAQAINKMVVLLGTFGVFFLGIIAKGFHWI